MNIALVQYLELLKEVDLLCERSLQDYKQYIACRPGCGECCVNISIFPLEWYAMERWLEEHPEAVPADPSLADTCRFLKEKSCSVYEIRSLICRTHGYPLVYLAEEYLDTYSSEDPAEPELEFTWCSHNFRGLNRENITKILDMASIINMEDLNTRLAELNYFFLDTEEGSQYEETRRYTINELLIKWLGDKRDRSK